MRRKPSATILLTALALAAATPASAGCGKAHGGTGPTAAGPASDAAPREGTAGPQETSRPAGPGGTHEVRRPPADTGRD